MINNALTSILFSFKRAITSGIGWTFAIVGNALAFFAPERYSFILVLTAVMFDAFFGTLASIKMGKFFISKFGRVTLFKIASYMLILMLIYMMEKLVHDNGFIGIKAAAAWAAACEAISMSASILIVWPNATFFSLFQKHLKGEIATKMGRDVGELFPDKK